MKVVLCLLLLSALRLRPVLSDEDCVEGEEDCSSAHAGSRHPRAEVQNSILILTDDNFGEVVKDEEMILVTFYAPW